ncbi:hypothetical protein [Flavobacterium bizetiae]|uniref:hypothetical protein n=1 Tax=Flavobacterium bizetiae TaxID=2704140 RepID=UPI003757D46E
MKKLLLFIVFAVFFTLFSCTADETETQQKAGTEKAINPSKTTYADGPGDIGTTPPPPVPKD